MFRRIDRAPSELPWTGKLVRAIEPWGALGRDFWESAAVRWAQEPECNPHEKLRSMGVQDTKCVAPPLTWERLEVQLRYSLEHRLHELDRRKFLNVAFPRYRDVLGNFQDFANEFRPAHDRSFNPESSPSVMNYALWLLDKAEEQESPWREFCAAWSIVLLEYAASRRFHAFCAVCYRRPVPDTQTCEIHAQSVTSSKSGAYQHARRVHEHLAQHRPDLWRQLRYDRVKEHSSHVSAQIFGDLVLDEELALEEIRSALQAAPSIRMRLFPSGALICLQSTVQILRDALDPLEIQATAWPWKILYAEALHSESMHVHLRRRGPAKRLAD
jgi:hypothetical protein